MMRAGERKTVATKPLTTEQQRLAETAIDLVELIALKTAKRVDLDDRIGYGYEGLVDAAATYDPSRGASFRTWAGRRIYAKIIDNLRDGQSSMIRLPRSAATVLSSDQRRRLQKTYFFSGFDGKARRSSDPFVGRIKFEETIASRSPDESSIDAELVQKAVDTLGARDAGIVRSYYSQGLTMRAIGETAGVAESRVSQILTAARDRLRDDPRIRVAAGMADCT